MIFREFEIEDINKGLLETYQEIWKLDYINSEIITNFLKNDNLMYVCEYNNQIIASATLHLQKKIIRNGGIVGMIEDVIVRESFRNNKIGEKLINHLVEKCKEIGCYKIILSCFEERVNFYKRCGFYEESKTMRINLK
jgi:glucosamine-phosphate N-acetyltransferase